MFRTCALILWSCALLHAAVIRGTVAEHNTGNSLARATVTLQPIGSTAAQPVTVRTSDSGNFEFHSLPAGGYIVKAARRGFLPLEYGQRQWNSAGVPVLVAADGSAFLNIRLHRPGAITGVVRDQNDIGMPGQDVIAYRNTEPPQLASRARSDDRGVFRIGDLEPGIYLIRTAGDEDNGISYVPTFAKQTLRTEDAQPVPVYLDEDSKGIDVRPAEGRLFSLAGFASPLPDGSTVTITLASDMGRRTAASPSFNFSGLPAGIYELYAEGYAAAPVNRFVGAYVQFTLDRNVSGFPLSMQEIQPTRFDFLPRQTAGNNAVQVLARRKDMAGVGTPKLLELNSDRASIPPGRWEMLVVPPASQYIAQFLPSRTRARPDGWNELTVQFFTSVRVVIAGGASSIRGTVRSAGEPVQGAPVFLEPWDPVARKRPAELRSTRSDAHGQYSFSGLAPGAYRLLSSFEYLSPDPAAMELANARTLTLEANTEMQSDAELYGIR